MKTNNLKAQIHIAKKQLGMDDDTYRAVLKRATSKTSSADMSVTELHRAIAEFKKLGFKPKSSKGYSPKSRGTRVDKLRAIWISMGKRGFVNGSEDALLNWVQNSLLRRNKASIDSLNWLNDHPEINRLIEQLKNWQARLEDKAKQDAKVK